MLADSSVIDVFTPLRKGTEPGRNTRPVADGVLVGMDRNEVPCDKLYEYASCSRLRLAKLPTDHRSFSKSLEVCTTVLGSLSKTYLRSTCVKNRNNVTRKEGFLILLASTKKERNQ